MIFVEHFQKPHYRRKKHSACPYSNFLLTIFTVRLAIFQKERRITKQFSTVRAVEAFRMEVLSNCLQAILKDPTRSKHYRRFQEYVLPL